jgi:hypothetical protein
MKPREEYYTINPPLYSTRLLLLVGALFLLTAQIDAVRDQDGLGLNDIDFGTTASTATGAGAANSDGAPALAFRKCVWV